MNHSPPAFPAQCKDKAPGYHLAVLHRLSAAYLAPRMQALGIRRGWIALLLEVLELPGQPQDALCKKIKIDRAVTARTLFDLEREGYVERREDARDRRQKLVYPTPRTLALADQLYTVLGEHNQALFKGFDAARQAETLTLLAAMAANLEAALGEEA